MWKKYTGGPPGYFFKIWILHKKHGLQGCAKFYGWKYFCKCDFREWMKPWFIIFLITSNFHCIICTVYFNMPFVNEIGDKHWSTSFPNEVKNILNKKKYECWIVSMFSENIYNRRTWRSLVSHVFYGVLRFWKSTPAGGGPPVYFFDIWSECHKMPRTLLRQARRKQIF